MTMKGTIALILAATLAFPAIAQEEANAVAEGAQGDAASSDRRPDMPTLFMRGEQRRILEIIRYGVVGSDNLDEDVLEEFTPVVFAQEVLPEEIEEPLLFVDTVRQERLQDLELGAYIRNNSTGISYLGVNGRLVHLQEDQDIIAANGLEIDAAAGADQSVVEGSDSYTDSTFKVKVGQILSVDGSVEETLPVIIIHKN